MKTPPPPRVSQRGATIVEYALVAALIAIVCIVALQTIGNRVITMMNAPIMQNGS